MARVDAAAMPGAGRPPLTLFKPPTRTPRAKAASKPGGGPSAEWERTLCPLMVAGKEPAGQPSSSEIGLQFELVAARPKGARRSAPGGRGIRVRPVLPGRTGNWVKTGVNWSSLDYVRYVRPQPDGWAEKLCLLKEFLALSRLTGAQHSYTYPNTEIWLEDINSRRVWDLLRQSRDVQLPLVTTGRRSLPVVVYSPTADVSIDVTRAGPDLLLEARVEVGGSCVPVDSSVLLGGPAHGLAWWTHDVQTSGRPGGAATADPQLHLAAFSHPIDDTLRGFVGREPIRVPGKDEHRFLREFCPALRRRVAVRTRDESVELPAEAPVELELSLVHSEGHRIALTWARTRAGSEWREPLWGVQAPFPSRDRDAEAALVEAVASVLRPMPILFELTPFGERLAPSAELAGMAALRFVTEILPELTRMPGVKIEQVGTVPDYREAAEPPVVSLSGSGSRDGDWFDLTVEVTVGGERVPFHELFVALATDMSHLILPSGTYFPLDGTELRQLAQLIAEARDLRDATGDRIRVSRFQASLWEDLSRLGVVTAQADAWVASVRALSETTGRTDHPKPEGLNATLRPYQEVGFNWLAFLYEHRLGGVLADDMGLGKTIQALALMCHTRETGLTSLPFLVIAPTSVVENWATECRRFAPDLSVVTISETERRRGVTLAAMTSRCDVVITSYALFRLEYPDYDAIEWAGLFVDEAQFAKNRNSKTYQQIKMFPVCFKVAMTGTPMENTLMELWSLLSIAAPGLFASPERFEEHYRAPIEKRADAERLDQLRRRVKPLMLRRTKEQVASDLPDRQEQVLELDLSPRHKKLYQTYLARERQKILGLLGDMTKNRFEIFRSLTLLRQASLDLSLVDPKHATVASSKLDIMIEMLDDIVADGHRVLVFSQFTRFLSQARRRIEAAGIECCYLDGRTRKRAEVISEFRHGGAPVFLISLKAGGFGLNLTEADYCILLDPWWNPATEAQAVDRVHRIGQTRKVMVYRLIAKDTIEEKVMALKAKKSALFASVLDAGGFESGALTAADIRGLLS